MENKYRFRDSSLSFDERVKDLLSRLTIKEKAGLMSSHMAAVPRLDIGEWYVGAEDVYKRQSLHCTSFASCKKLL